MGRCMLLWTLASTLAACTRQPTSKPAGASTTTGTTASVSTVSSTGGSRSSTSTETGVGVEVDEGIDGDWGGAGGCFSDWDCNEDEKCAVGGDCIPVPADAGRPGQACAPAEGVDGCVHGVVCFLEPNAAQGTCLVPCSPTPPDCEERRECVTLPAAWFPAGDGLGVAVCLQRCDPLTPTCPDGHCTMVDWDEPALCTPPLAQYADQGDPCAHVFFDGPVCGPNLWCDGTNRCAAPCDADAPDPCPDGFCNPLGWPAHENLGFCVVP